MAEKVRKPSKVSRRGWLNDRSSCHTGAYSWQFNFNAANSSTSIDASLSIWDCSKKITLDFDSWDVPARKNALKKARLLHKELGALVKKLEEAEDYIECMKKQ